MPETPSQSKVQLPSKDISTQEIMGTPGLPFPTVSLHTFCLLQFYFTFSFRKYMTAEHPAAYGKFNSFCDLNRYDLTGGCFAIHM